MHWLIWPVSRWIATTDVPRYPSGTQLTGTMTKRLNIRIESIRASTYNCKPGRRGTPAVHNPQSSLIRGVAQLGRALPSGGRSRRFESFHPDQNPELNQQLRWMLFYARLKSSTLFTVLQFFGLHAHTSASFFTAFNCRSALGSTYGSEELQS